MAVVDSDPVLDGMPRRLFRATPTRLTTWLDCPRKYRFSYLDSRPKGPPWAHNSVGVAAHNALRDWWSDRVADRTATAAADLVRRHWIQDGFRDREQSVRWREATARVTADYAGGLDPTAEPRGVERTVAATTAVLTLSGRVDRIDERDSEDGGRELVVVDYKTGRRECTVDEARSSLALAVYLAGARRTFRLRSRRVELHHLPSGTVAAHEHTEQSLARHLARADEIGTEAAAAGRAWRDGLAARAADAADGDVAANDAIDAVFPPRPGPMCSWCDFRAHCPQGSDSSERLQTWAALAD